MSTVLDMVKQENNNEKKEWDLPTIELISKDLIANQFGNGGDGGAPSSNAS